MRILEISSKIAKEIDNTLEQVEFTPPEFNTQYDKDCFAVDILRIDNFEQRSGRGIVNCQAEVVIMFYKQVDDIFINTLIDKLGYDNLQTFLNLYNELVALDLIKIVTYNTGDKKALALRIKLILQNV